MTFELASITHLGNGTKVDALFNPSEYSVNKDNNFAQIAVPGLSSPLLQFVNGNLRTLEMELFFDSYEQHRLGSRVLTAAHDDVRKLTQPVVDLMAIDPETHAPPIVLFNWGSLSFTGVLAHVSQRYQMFLDDGTPVRARLQVTFQEVKSAEDEAREVKRQTADYDRMYLVGEGETLASVAWSTYRNSAMWRPIAIANDILDARHLPVGIRLVVPSLPYRDPATGEVYGS
jgi:Contractile injection system tube protein